MLREQKGPFFSAKREGTEDKLPQKNIFGKSPFEKILWRKEELGL
jgi:hypothetical protein